MADKEATVYIVDVGRSMGRKNQGRYQSDLEWAMLYVWDKITSTVPRFPAHWFCFPYANDRERWPRIGKPPHWE